MNQPRRGTARIGTSGYQYDHWRGVFYPEGLPKTRWFERYAEEFDTVEINNTFYSLPKEKTFDHWREQTPEGFVYSLKFSRYGTHIKRLKEPQDTIGAFLERAERLRGFLGPILVQLPPRWNINLDRLEGFLQAAPRSHRWAFEFRDESWLVPETFDLLRARGAALCLHDMIEDHPVETTADWVYLRYHGDHYAGRYSPQALTAQARRIKEWLGRGMDVCAYFNNDAEGNAVVNARQLREYAAP